MVGAGAVAVSDDGKPVASAQLMRTALEYARTFGIPVADHCEEPTLAAGGAMNEGIVSARLGLKGIPAEAEEIMVIRDILLARRTGGHVHLAHMSTQGSVELIRWGKERGIRVTAEVCPHHLSLTEDAVEGYDTNAKMNPPLRTADGRRGAAGGGAATARSTSSRPTTRRTTTTRRSASSPTRRTASSGSRPRSAVSSPTSSHPGIIDYATLVDRMSLRAGAHLQPAGRLAARGRGGGRTVFDPNLEWTVDPSTFLSKGRNTPYAGDASTGARSYASSAADVVYRLRERVSGSATRDPPSGARSSPSAGGCTSAGSSPGRTATSRCVSRPTAFS